MKRLWFFCILPRKSKCKTVEKPFFIASSMKNTYDGKTLLLNVNNKVNKRLKLYTFHFTTKHNYMLYIRRCININYYIVDLYVIVGYADLYSTWVPIYGERGRLIKLYILNNR